MIDIVQSENYRKNRDRYRDGNAYPCIICGKPVPKPKHMVRIWDGVTVVSTQEAEELTANGEEAGDTGYYPIGSDCLRKNPQYKPYTK